MVEFRHVRRYCRWNTLPASTLVEALVASIIFLVIFAVSLETTVRITASGDGSGYRYTMVLEAVDGARQKYSTGGYREGTYEDETAWGSLATEISKYEGYENIYRLNIRATVRNDVRRLQYDFLFETEN